MSAKLDTAIARLSAAFSTYDGAKTAHAETTCFLAEAKKQVDLCARAVVDASHGQPDLFDHAAQRGAQATPTKTHETTVDGQPARVVTQGADDDDGDVSQDELSDLAEEIAEEREVVLSGTTGGPVDTDLAEYNFAEHIEAPGLCLCGWEIASPVAGHDRRHRQYLAAVKDEKNDSAADVAGTPHKPARVRRKVAAKPAAASLTAAVAKRSRSKKA